MLAIRPCLGCGQEDDHPRDVVALPDGNTAYFHHDCHALLGCQSCKWLVKHKGKLKGAKWLEQIQALHADLSQEQLELPPWDRDIHPGFRAGVRAIDAQEG